MGACFPWPAPVAFCFLLEESALVLLLTLSDPSQGELPLPRLHSRASGGFGGCPCGGRRQGKVDAKCRPELPLSPGLLPELASPRPCYPDICPRGSSLRGHPWTWSEPPRTAHPLTPPLHKSAVFFHRTHCFPWKIPSEKNPLIPDVITHSPTLTSSPTHP